MVGTARTAGRVVPRFFRHFAQRAFCAARMWAIAEADNLRFYRAVIGATFPFAFAHRAR